MPEKPKIVDVFTLTCGEIATAHHQWIMKILLTEQQAGRYQIRLHASYAQPVANNRNTIVNGFLQGDGDYLIMIDEDQAAGFNPLDFITHDCDILGFPAPVWRSSRSVKDAPTRMNVWLDDEEGRPTGGALRTADNLMPIAGGIGAGCIIIARRVLEHPAMRAPFLDTWDANGLREASEDRNFCLRARKAGFTVWIAPHHSLSHFKRIDLLRVHMALEAARAKAEGRYVPPQDAFMHRRQIFTLSPGRCATRWLAQALATLPEVDAYHEPDPEFRHVLRVAQYDRTTALRFWLENKLPAMAKSETPVYVETSHLFIEGFAQSLLDIGIVPDLIVIRRPHREVALSMWRRGAIPGRGREEMNGYHVQPDDPGVVMKPTSDWHEWTDYQVCYWYCLEIAARIDYLVPMFRNRGSTICETSMAEMVTRRGIDALTGALGLERVPALPEASNRNPAPLAERAAPDNLDAQEAAIVH